MTDRERLLLLLHTSGWDIFSKPVSDNTEKIADYLLANGVIVPPCKVGDTVYVITDCSRIIMHCDNDYETGTGAIECPFEDVCKFEECNDINTQALETYVSFLLCDEYDDWTFGCEDINSAFSFSEIGKTVFLTREEAEQALAERSSNDATH